MKLIQGVAYLRVSTDRQAEEGQGLAVQEAAIRKWAKGEKVRLIAVLRDEGVSGTKDGLEREGLAEALALIADHRAERLVVHHLDRLARSLTVQEAILAQIWKHGGSVWTLSGEIPQDDPDDPMRTFVRQVMGAAAQLERGMIAARLRSGRRMKAEKGGYAFGAPRFGTRAEDGALVPDESEAEAVMFAAEQRRAGASLREICRSLDAHGYRPRRGGAWHPVVVSRILARTDVGTREFQHAGP